MSNEIEKLQALAEGLESPWDAVPDDALVIRDGQSLEVLLPSGQVAIFCETTGQWEAPSIHAIYAVEFYSATGPAAVVGTVDELPALVAEAKAASRGFPARAWEVQGAQAEYHTVWTPVYADYSLPTVVTQYDGECLVFNVESDYDAWAEADYDAWAEE